MSIPPCLSVSHTDILQWTSDKQVCCHKQENFAVNLWAT